MIIGIFGGIGSGKSTVSIELSRRNYCKIYELDKIVHKLYKKNACGYNAIIRICGKAVLNSNNEIDRCKLSELLFNDEVLLKKVNEAIHPMAWAKVADLAQKYKKSHNHTDILIEAALLPPERYTFLERTIYIKTDVNVRKKRVLASRNISSEKFDSIIDSQPTDEEYSSFADIIIENDQGLDMTLCNF